MTFITIDFPPYTEARSQGGSATPSTFTSDIQPSAPPQQTEEETSFKSDVVNTIKTAVKESVNKGLDATEEVVETIAQHKYARLANASYDYFNSKGDPDAVAKGLSDPKYSYIDDLAGFEMDKDLSTIDNLVLHNAATGETVVSYRGTTDNPLGETKNFLNDWKTNAQIAGGKTNTQRVREADAQMDRVISKYGKENLKTVGHSQGGHVSFELGQKYDVPSYSYNPAINKTQAFSEFEGSAEHQIFKTPLDFASPLAYKKMPGTNVKITQNIKGMDDVVETHSIDQFTPEVESVVGEDAVKVVRRTMAGSVVKGVGTALNAAAYGYTVGTTIAEDVKEGQTGLKTGLDVAKKTEQFVVDSAIIEGSIAAIPETFGASIIIGGAAVMLHDMAGDELEKGVVKGANVVAEEVKSVAETSKRTAKKVGSWFKRHLGL